jgi:hypothetical protein
MFLLHTTAYALLCTITFVLFPVRSRLQLSYLLLSLSNDHGTNNHTKAGPLLGNDRSTQQKNSARYATRAEIL